MSGLFRSPQPASSESATSPGTLMAAANPLQNQALQFSMLTPMMVGGTQGQMQYMKGNYQSDQ